MFVRCPATTPPRVKWLEPEIPHAATSSSSLRPADELGQARMVPADLPDPGFGGVAEPHLKLVSDHDPDDQVLPGQPSELGRGEGGRDDVGGVGRVVHPVD